MWPSSVRSYEVMSCFPLSKWKPTSALRFVCICLWMSSYGTAKTIIMPEALMVLCREVLWRSLWGLQSRALPCSCERSQVTTYYAMTRSRLSIIHCRSSIPVVPQYCVNIYRLFSCSRQWRDTSRTDYLCALYVCPAQTTSCMHPSCHTLYCGASSECVYRLSRKTTLSGVSGALVPMEWALILRL